MILERIITVYFCCRNSVSAGKDNNNNIFTSWDRTFTTEIYCSNSSYLGTKKQEREEFIKCNWSLYLKKYSLFWMYPVFQIAWPWYTLTTKETLLCMHKYTHSQSAVWWYWVNLCIMKSAHLHQIFLETGTFVYRKYDFND